MPIHLHIFEERYKLMIRQVIESDHTFGVVLIRNGMEALGPLAQPHWIGCTAKIINVDPLPDGRMNLVAFGHDRFRIQQLDTGLPFLRGQVETYLSEQPRTLEVVREARALSILIRNYLRMMAAISEITGSELEDEQKSLEQLQLADDPTLLVFMACGLLQIPANEKQALLEIASVPHLLEHVFRLYKRELSVNPRLLQTPEETSRRSSWLN
jgi:Lon protease-like protein